MLSCAAGLCELDPEKWGGGYAARSGNDKSSAILC